MQVKRFTGANTAAALRAIKAELGPEAVILSTNRLQGGRVEVSAAIEPERASQTQTPALGDLAAQVAGLGSMLKRHLVSTEAANGFVDRPEVAPFYRHFSEQEIDGAVIAELLDGLAPAEGHGVAPRVGIRLKKMLKVMPPENMGASRVMALVGPTGVGKTTTVAKLAAGYALDYGLKVGLITVDTFRIAAPQQLKVYGQIMDIPTLVAADKTELAEALKSLAHCDRVLIDTVGRSPADEDNLDELADLLGSVLDLACHLVLACPTREADQKSAVEAFGRFKPRSLIFTKLDETGTFGPILNRVAQTNLPLSYLTFGQQVPEDIEPAAIESLTRRLMPPRKTPRES